MALEIFAGVGAALLDVPTLADQHRHKGLRLMVGVAEPMGMDAARPVTLEYDGEASTDAMVRELLRLAEVGRQALMVTATTQSGFAGGLLARLRTADSQLRLIMGPARPAAWLSGPPDETPGQVVEFDA